GPVDPAAVLPGAIVDARAMPGWTTEIDRIDQTPAGERALVRGTYEAEGFLARVTLALVIAADGETGGQRLVQLTVTVPADADGGLCQGQRRRREDGGARCEGGVAGEWLTGWPRCRRRLDADPAPRRTRRGLGRRTERCSPARSAAGTRSSAGTKTRIAPAP